MAWCLGGFAAMLGIGLTLVEEMRTFPGGAAGLEAVVLPGAQAFRMMRWPAEHLDTVGGYLTYHNITLFAFFLAVYGAVQGARAIRGGEERGSVETILATGWGRWAIVRDRALGFTLALTVIATGLALGTAWALVVGDAPDLVGSFVTMTATALCGLVGFALGVLVSQFTRTSRLASGISVLILTALYVLTNVDDQIGPAGVLAYLSPFHYSNLSRALVPGLGLDPLGMLALVGMAVVALALAGWAFQRRDYGSPLWGPGPRAPRMTAPTRVQRPALRHAWSVALLRGRVGLIAWTVSTAVFAWLYMSLAPTFMDAWESFSFAASLSGGGPGTSPKQMYNAFESELVAPILAAYAITQAATWVADLEQGRVEMMIATGLSATRLVLERLLAVLVGCVVITAFAVVAMVVSGSLVGNDVEMTSVLRAAACGLLFAMAMAGLAALLVAWLRTGLAVVLLAVYLGAAYLLTLIVPVLGWPEWTERLSVFWAFGHPYLDWPTTGGLVLLLGMALGGPVAAAVVSERRPKVP